MERLVRFVLSHPRSTLVVWGLLLAAFTPFALQLGRVAQGGSEAIRGSESHAVMQTLEREFGRGFAHPVPVVVTHENLSIDDPRYPAAVASLTSHLSAQPIVRGVVHFWNSGLPELRGRDGHSVLLLVQPDASTLIQAEDLTGPLRSAIADARLPAGFSTHVTGMSAMFSDFNRRSSVDLLHAEMVGIPLTLIVLLFVFRSPWAAGLALGIAMAAVTLSSAILSLLSPWVPVSVFAQNVVSMIGLGAGTDYALFILAHHRHARASGQTASETVIHAVTHAGPAVLVSGLAVAGGFAALCLVNATFMRSLALGGVTVVAGSLVATLTLLPVLLHYTQGRIPWAAATAPPSTPNGWARWAGMVMGKPWLFLGLAFALTAIFAWPARRAAAWTFGPHDLPPESEARSGYDLLAARFEKGWMGPVVLTLEGGIGDTMWGAPQQDAVLQLADELGRDGRVAHVLGFPRLLAALGPLRAAVTDPAALPAELAPAARSTVGSDGRTAVIVIVPRHPPEARPLVDLVTELRANPWPNASAAGLRVKVGGGTALVQDFDAEMFGSLKRVMPAVLALTFLLLLIFFRSLAVPLKAILANLLSVLASYGFLVLLFQDGHGIELLGLAPPGGLNSFVVLMLFTILFGLSMDYEIFLLSEMRLQYRRNRDNAASVATGLASTAGVITSAAAVMVCLFGSFGFFGLMASREFGLGLAFAVAFDATVVRLLIVPAAMRLLGAWNWWPGAGTPVKR